MAGIEKTRWQAVSPLLDELLDADAAQRAARIEQLRKEDRALADDVAALLAREAAVETAHFLEGLAVDPIGTATLAGRTIGSYTLERPLGQGGMGSVWLARRSDGRFEGQAAVKFLDLALLARGGAERFAREGSVLARLAHPNIARLIDAGVDAGQPYLVLEYVDGVPIDRWCDARVLGVQARVRLFLAVLAAVAHAHGRLILHRDLKPSNILVTADGQVKLLDFGIAALIEDPAQPAPASELTRFAGRAFTPEYAAPEQVQGGDVTMASDVYALGVVLYVLLAGAHPTARAGGSQFEQLRALVDAEPAPLSERALRVDPAAARARAATPQQLSRALRGDLDTIVAKALKKRPGERYATSTALADDLRRWLDHEPIGARSDSLAYRAGKFVRRHRLAVAGAAAIAAALIAGGSAALWQASLAREQARIAQRQALRAQTVQKFLLDIFRTNTDQQDDPVKARATTARELLDIGARRAAENLKDAPEVQDEVLATLADMYAQMRLNAQAVDLHRQRVEALKRAYGARDPRVAEALLALAEDLSNTNARAELPALFDEAEQILDAAGDRSPVLRAALLMGRADLARYSSPAKMREYADRAVALLRTGAPERSGPLVEAMKLAALGRLYAGDAAAAEPMLRELVAFAEQRFPQAPVWHVVPLVHLAEAQARLARVDDAEANFRRALALSQRVWGEYNGDALQTMAKLGGYLHSTGRRAEGRALLFAALHALGREKGNDRPNTVGTIRHNLGVALTADGRAHDAHAFLAAEIDDLRQNLPRSQPLARALVAQADAEIARGRYAATQSLLDEADAIERELQPQARGPNSNPARFARARLLLAQGRAADALAVLEKVVVPPPSPATALPLDDLRRRLLEADALLSLGRAGEAGGAARTVLEVVQASPVRAYFEALESEAALLLDRALRAQGDTG